MCLIISNLVQPMSNPFRAIGGAYGQKWAFWAKNGRFRVSGDPRCHFLGAPKGPNWSPWMCLTMSNLVQPISNPFGAAGGAYVRKWPSLAEYGHSWGLWRPPVPFFGGPKGPNRSPWMCLTMSNLVQPMSNPFGTMFRPRPGNVVQRKKYPFPE